MPTTHKYVWEVNRVLVNEEGEAVSPTGTQIEPDIIFVRRDGWSLAAATELEQVAFQLWSEEWESYARRENAWMLEPMEVYPDGEDEDE